MGPTALLSFRRKKCYGFLSSLKIYRPRPGLNPQAFGKNGNHANHYTIEYG
jgi:hypothetical protein